MLFGCGSVLGRMFAWYFGILLFRLAAAYVDSAPALLDPHALAFAAAAALFTAWLSGVVQL